MSSATSTATVHNTKGASDSEVAERQEAEIAMEAHRALWASNQNGRALSRLAWAVAKRMERMSRTAEVTSDGKDPQEHLMRYWEPVWRQVVEQMRKNYTGTNIVDFTTWKSDADVLSASSSSYY
ncbi:unnamed protein product [Amoebophrya sp. A25]|nr:unnamed protein product [Amoebophrya sp. A25]|eukprot:GSA25T00024828001.1